MRFAIAFAVLIATTFAAEALVSRALSEGSAAGHVAWIDARDVRRLVRARERDGMIPQTVECRHDPREPAYLVKPQVRLSWARNEADRPWRFKVSGASRADAVFRRFYRQQGFRLVSSVSFDTGRDQEWVCEIWHRP